MAQFLNFSEISQKILFKDVLDWLNIPYSVYQNGEIRGEHFIINPGKNLYFNPNGDDKGSIINFLSKHKGVDLRTAAQELKDHFLKEEKPPKREIPNLELHYCPFLKEKGYSEDFCQAMEIGLVKERSIISGRIAFKCYDETGEHSGYVAYHPQKDEWFFPKGFKRTLYNPSKFTDGEVSVTSDIFTCLNLLKEDKRAVSLIGKSMTETQESQLSQFTRVVLVHPEPDNVAVRLMRKTFVRIAPN